VLVGGTYDAFRFSLALLEGVLVLELGSHVVGLYGYGMYFWESGVRVVEIMAVLLDL
jgi:hypothetical protein